MAEPTISDEQLALLLQASREFAFEQMSAGKRVLPFATRVRSDGEVEFVCFVEETSTQPLEEIYEFTRNEMAKQAKAGEIVAASLVAAVELQAPESGFSQAIQIHMEAPDFCRQVLAPYNISDEAEGDSGEKSASIALGELIPLAADTLIYRD